MNPAENPYEAPRTNPFAAPPANGRVWRAGKVLCLDKGAALPPRCVRCNAPAERSIERKLYWHSPWWALTILAGLLTYAIVTLIVRKRAYVGFPLCGDHARARSRRLAAASILAALGLAVPFAVPHESLPPAVLVAMVSVVAALIVAGRQASVLRPVRIDEREVRLAGAGRNYLDSLEREAA